ncbi:MAG: hypothetical protein P4L46_02020 [Fimbriimonas sp.]|nr:hypothetical protein [Fimbriimonas sp.]
MRTSCVDLTCRAWLAAAYGEKCEELGKESPETRAWIGEGDGQRTFLKWYPTELCEGRGEIERSISGTFLHPAIVPLRRLVHCTDGDLHVYDFVEGLNLAGQSARRQFALRPVAERISVVQNVMEALGAICEAGFTVVDWHEGNMHYDFNAKKIWLFDWDLCRRGPSFTLEMESNYGTSRLMAPEELVRGSSIDQMTLVFNLGRFAMIYLPELAEDLADILAKATHPSRKRRFETARALADALRDSLKSE